MIDPYCIAVAGEPKNGQLEAVLSLLEGVMPLRWFSLSEQDQPEISGKILILGAGDASRDQGPASEVPSLSVPQSQGQLGPGVMVEVSFSDFPEVPFPFRGRTLRTTVALPPTILVPADGEKVLARSGQGPVWTLASAESTKHYRSGFALPQIPVEGKLLDVLNGQRFLEILPVLHWLREIIGTEDAPQVDPPLRACFIFDDPNLHWPHYGFANYQQLAASAQEHNYHIAFAAIPLDTWFTHSGTAAIFRENKSRLSLLIHGNNHTKRELAQPGTTADRVCLLKEAITRIERLEGQSGLEVSRVMVPPHGACSEEMLMALAVCTFEAVCLSHAGLAHYSKGKDWTRYLGYLPFELIQGCPVVPRWPLTGAELENTVLLAAYLKQALILYGHHGDLKNGPAILERAADFINSLGRPVQWLDMSGVVASGHLNKEGLGSRVVQTRDSSLEPTPSYVTRDGKRRTIKEATVPFIRRFLTEGRDRLLAGAPKR